MDEFIKKLEEKYPNWNISKTDIGLEFSQYTDAGEDFFFEVEGSIPEELADAIYEYYQNFDPEEHVMMWLEAKQNGVKNVPDVFVLVDDVKKIEEDLENLSIKACRIAEELEEQEESEEDEEEEM